MITHQKFSLLCIILVLVFSCHSKKGDKHTKQSISTVDTTNQDTAVTGIALAITSSPAYTVLDSLQAAFNMEVRVAYNHYLIHRKENNAAAIINLYQSNMPFPQKRQALDKLGLTFPPALDQLSDDIAKTANKLATEFPILNDPIRSPAIIKKALEIKPQTGVTNPLNIKL